MAMPHILLITLDTLRADHVGCYGCSPVETPNLDAVAAGGVRFAEHLTSVSATLASHACLMTGCSPTVHGIVWNGITAPCRRRTLAQIAAASGYATTAITSWGGFATQQVYGFQTAHSESRAAHPDNRGERTLERVLAWLSGTDPSRPHLLWVHLIDPHAPDMSPPPYPATYPGSVAFTDFIVGELVRAWNAKLTAEATLAVITADHGEHLEDHGIPRGHGTIWETCLRVPLLMRAPGLIPPRAVVPELTRQIDVLPTILDYAGLPMPHNVEGMSLRGLISGEEQGLRLVHLAQAVHSQGDAVAIRNAEYAFHFGEGRRLAGVYDRRRDPAEETSLLVDGAVIRHSAEHSIRDAQPSD